MELRCGGVFETADNITGVHVVTKKLFYISSNSEATASELLEKLFFVTCAKH